MTLDSQDSPRPGLRGSRHLPPYSILCVFLWHLHPNGFLSRDSQGGVLKLSWFGLLPLCGVITFYSNLRLRLGIKQTYSSHWKLSNGMSHFTYTHRGRVDSRLSVVGSQTANLTIGLLFCHNLCCRCPNGSCEPIFDIYTLIVFQWYKECIDARCFDPCNRILKFWESWQTPKFSFRECESHPRTLLKVGLWQKVMFFIQFKQFKTKIELQFGKPIKALRFDKGG